MFTFASTLARCGLLNVGSPVRIVRQLDQLRRWGFGLAGELRQAAARSPGRLAVIDDEGSLTYADLLARCEALSAALGVGPGDRVGLLCRNSAAMIESLVAVSMAGADPVLLNTGLSGPQLDAVVAQQAMRLIIHSPEFAPPGRTLSTAAFADDHAAALPDTPDQAAGLLKPPGHAAGPLKPPAQAASPLKPPERPGRTIVLTSGTTGVPKGATRPTPGGFGPLISIIDRIPLRVESRVMISAPLFHTWGFAALQLALALRVTIVLRAKFSPPDVVATLAGLGCDALVAVPVMVQNLLELPSEFPVPRLSVVAVSGSALPGALATRFMDRYGDVLYNLYGSTEASWISIATPADLRAAPGTAGRPPHGTKVAVLDPAGARLPPGTPGRLFVGNEMLFEGYTSAGATAKELRDGMLATGDVGHVDEAGRVFVDGREDDMIISGGENVFPSEVENLLADLPAIREVAVLGVPDDTYGQRLAAYVVLHPGEVLSADEVKEHVRKYRARFCVPRDVFFLDALPRNATGKVVPRELR